MCFLFKFANIYICEGYKQAVIAYYCEYILFALEKNEEEENHTFS